MGYFTNTIRRRSLQPGDHIYAYRQKHTYTHHGIYIGENRVIHFNKTQETGTSRQLKPCKECGVDRNQLQGVVKSCVKCFRKGKRILINHRLRRYRYGVSFPRYLINRNGTCTTGNADTPQNIISRANYYFDNKNSFGDYDLLDKNCETFALYCTTGKLMSNQAQWFKLMVKGFMDLAVERLLFDVSVHHDQETYNRLKQFLNNLSDLSSPKQILADLRLFHFLDGNDDDDEDDEDDEDVVDGDGDGDDDDDDDDDDDGNVN